MDRRSYLAGVSTGLVVASAGCTETESTATDRSTTSSTTNGPAGLRGSVRPAGDPDPVRHPLTCDTPDFERQERHYDDATWGDAGAFTLRIDAVAYDYGHTAAITLTNVSGDRTVTGNRVKHQFEAYTEAGWQPVGGWADGDSVVYPDEGRIFQPGETLDWTIELTESGVSEPQSDEYTVCPALRSGRYRFVFWGVDRPLAVAFDLGRGR